MKKQKKDSWKKQIMSLSETKGNNCINPIMAYPNDCHLYNRTHKEKNGYICHCDDGYLCEHRAKWLIKFISNLLSHQRQEMIDKERII